MHKAGVEGRRKRRFRATMDSRHRCPVVGSQLERRFSAERPDQAWVITNS
jgi:hypothetical protein